MNTLNPFVICRAAAGSGKTFTLVKEYLKLALTPPSAETRRHSEGWHTWISHQFATILAITFTNKAAGEMKQRIMDSLWQMANFGTDPHRSKMGKGLMEDINSTPSCRLHPLSEKEFQEMARLLYVSILHHYTDLSVCTIDSFMHRVVRTFAHELDKPVDFEVLIDHDDIIEHAVEGVMQLVGTEGNEELTRVVQAFANQRMEDNRSYHIEGALSSLAGQLFREDVAPYLDALSQLTPQDFIDMQRELTRACHEFERQVADCGERMMHLLEGVGATAIDCANGAKGYHGFFLSASKGRIRPLTATTARAFEEGKLASGKCKQSIKDALDGIAPAMFEQYSRMRKLVGLERGDDPDEGFPLRTYTTYQLLLRNIYTMALIGELNNQVHRYAEERGVVHLSEFNSMISTIVSEQSAPFIYERLGNRYRHFLIDEFQDTSVLQWHNLVPLLENGVAGGHESLVVGDGKQAIYRFRQGDVRQFVELPHVSGMALHGHTLENEANFSLVPLHTNYRTARSIVGFNNAFFEWLLQQRAYSDNPLAQQIYIGVRDSEGHPELYQHLPESQQLQGSVEVTFVGDEEEEAVCEEIRSTIVRLVREKGYKQSDIMVLARYNRELDTINSYLQAHSEEMPIEVTSSESFFLTRSHAVLAILSALRLLHDADDRVAVAELLQHLHTLGLIQSPHHEAFLTDGAINISALLQAEEGPIRFRPDYLMALDLYDCCEALIRELTLDGIDTVYVASLLGRVSDYAIRHHEGVAGFLQWFDDHATADFTSLRRHQLSAATPEGVDAVRLLTIHKAKGLEAPVVILPLFSPDSRSFNLWVDLSDGMRIGSHQLPAAYVELGQKSTTHFDSARDTEQALHQVDMLNILYVALTRPRERLVIVGTEPDHESAHAATDFGCLLDDFLSETTPDMGDASFVHPQSSTADRNSAISEVSLRHVSFADWTTKVQVASPAESALTPLMQERIRLGNWLHDMMAHVGTASDLNQALAQVRNSNPMSEADAQHLLEMARAVVQHPDALRFFDSQHTIKTECSIVDSQGIIRPDRIVVASGETWVVDYKTGQDLGVQHDRQLQRYCRALSEMGFPSVSGWLIYLDNDIRIRQAC